MPKTLTAARKQARQFKKNHPDMDVIIIDNTKIVPRNSSFRYNFRFRKKTGTKQRIVIQRRSR